MDFEYFKKILENCHLNFLIGSGASKPYLGTLGEIENLLTELSKSEIDIDNKTIIDASIKKKYWDVAISGNINISDNLKGNLETTKTNYTTFYESVQAIIQKRKTNLISKQANIFTTNMDLFNEFALENQAIIYNDGFLGRLNPEFDTTNFNNSIKKTSSYFEYQTDLPFFNLFKLHGSLNWKMGANDKIFYDNNLSCLHKINEILIKDEDLLEIEYTKKIRGKEKWYPYTVEELNDNIASKKIKRKKAHQDFLDEYDKLVMINPTKDKFETTTRKLVFYELLRMFSNILEKENSVLIVFGFSFADEHICEIVQRVAKSNPTLLILIFAYNVESQKQTAAYLNERNNIVYIFDENIEYSLDVINENFFGRLCKELNKEY